MMKNNINIFKIVVNVLKSFFRPRSKENRSEDSYETELNINFTYKKKKRKK